MKLSKNINKYMTFWRGEFADYYKRFPRLYKALVENNVLFDEKDDCLSVTFFVKHSIHKQWIEVNHYDGFVEKLLDFTDCRFVELNIVPEDDLPDV